MTLSRLDFIIDTATPMPTQITNPILLIVDLPTQITTLYCKVDILIFEYAMY